jgi:hypothetical protein
MTTYNYAEVYGHKIFYREAEEPSLSATAASWISSGNCRIKTSNTSNSQLRKHQLPRVSKFLFGEIPKG